MNIESFLFLNNEEFNGINDIQSRLYFSLLRSITYEKQLIDNSFYYNEYT
jgi:hypothetical protein